jgi:hypothetical protein
MGRSGLGAFRPDALMILPLHAPPRNSALLEFHI